MLQVLRTLLIVAAFLALSGCWETKEDAYWRGYNDGAADGFLNGQQRAREELCDEVEDLSPEIRNQLSGC